MLGGNERAKKEGAHNDGNGMMKVEGKGNQIATDTHTVCVCVFVRKPSTIFNLKEKSELISCVKARRTIKGNNNISLQ